MSILYSILLTDKQKTAVNSLNKLSLKDSSNSSEDETFSMIQSAIGTKSTGKLLKTLKQSRDPVDQ